MSMELKPNFTPRAQEAIVGSRKIAQSFHKRVINEDHLSLSLASVQSLSLLDFYTSCGIEQQDIVVFIRNKLTKGESKNLQKSYFSSKFKMVLSKAVKLAETYEHDFVGIEHILLALLDEDKCAISLFLSSKNISPDQAKLSIRARFLVAEAETSVPAIRAETRAAETTKQRQPQSQTLEKYATNLNALATQGKFDLVIGRSKEIKDMEEVLCRRTKNNPILLGEPGVGKTAVVEGLAQQIVQGDCTDFLANKTIYSLDLAGMIAGTKYRGQFEERLKKALEEISKDDRIVLFIDEIHTLVGAGSAEGTMDAANILKPLLARGELMCIGATTRGEYKKTILKDGALDRRFQPILIEEPSQKDCLKILKGIKEKYEKFHGVKYDEECLELSIKLSSRHIPDRQLPDKAIDLLDQAGSKAKIRGYKRPTIAREIEDQIAELYAKEESSSEPHILIRKRENLLEKYTKIIEDWAEEATKNKVEVEATDIYQVLTQKTGIPSEDLSEAEKDKVLNLEKNLNKLIIGQKDAVKKISKSILRNKAGLGEEGKPIGSFLLLGSSGVGKSYLAKQISNIMFGGTKNLIQLDMSEFSEKSSSSKLLGASPGYVGFEESNSIVDRVRKNPYSVILFDEIEKAHAEVTQLLLQVLEEGSVTDSSGRKASFKNCIIVLTGNIGSALTKKSNTVGFGQSTESQVNTEEKVKELAKQTLKPELVNRIDSVVIFQNFAENEIKNICKLELEKLQRRTSDKINKLKFNPSIINFITEEALKENDGARPIKKIIKRKIETPLAEKILEQNQHTQISVSLSYVKGEVKLSIKE
mgnify:CR=1 FL=1